MAEFDYLGAKQAGASDEEIQSFLKANGTDFDLIGAKQAGATDDEISTFLKSQPVKKKEVSKPTTQVSSNGTTKTSQSSYNLDLSLPKVNPNPNNKALPGLGQPFKPEIALKSINDERKFINAKTPTQTNFQDYNTVINDGIKGQNKFDNTTQILTSQNVIPQQAKKEVQQLQQKQQVVKDAKKDTRQNILAVIPELADAKNTDEAISTILKSDMKNNLDYWQQFDDEALLGNDENTLNDFLVSNGLKNQDRELYLKEQASSNPKYGYEYEYNKIGSLFKAVKQRADDYDTVLKQKFGDNYMEVAKQGNSDILNDQDFNKFRQLREKQNELSTKANGLINDSRYSEVKSSREKVEKAQQGVDERAKNDKIYKIGDELNYIGNKLAYGAGHVVKMIAELPSLATSIDKGYDWTDKVADWGNRFSDNLIESIPVSTDKKTGVFNKVADVDGYKVFVDESGEPIDVRDKNNFKVPLSVSQSVVEKFSSNPQTYKTRNEMNSGALVDNGLNTMIDMGIMILGTKGAGMVGAGEKLQKLTSMGIAYQQTKRDVFNDAIKKGLDPRNADLLSNIIGVAAGTSSMINPMEFNIAKGAGLFNLLKTDGLNAAKLALIKDGKLSVKDYAKEFVSGAIKNTIGENIEELGIENTTQAIANNHFNNQISETDMVDGGLDDRLHILDKQGLETFLITAGSSFLMTPIEINSQTQFNQQEAMKMAIENPEDFAKIKELQLKQGQISQQQFDNETKIYNDVSKTYNAVKDDVKEELQPQLLALLTKKSNLSNKISEIKDEVLSKPYKDQLEQVNKGIESISVGKNADKRLVAPIEQSEILAESTAKDGSSTITKVETEIANKINKGQELTAEETDYYNAQKDSIDKLVTVNKSPIVPINETVEVEKKKIVLPPPTPQVVAPAELDEQQITEQLNEVLNDKTTPTPLVDTEQEQNISERLPSEYQNNQGVQQGDGQNVSNENEVAKVEEEQEEGSGVVDKASNVGGDVESTAKALEGVDVVQHLRDKTNALRDEQGNIPKDKMEKFKALRKASGAVNDGLVQIPESNYENTGRSKKFTPKQISEAYHKAKADGSNPELVKAVEDLIGKPTAQTPENNQGVQQVNGIGQDVSNESEVPQIKQEQEVVPIVNTETKVVTPTATPEILDEIKSKNLTHVRGKNMGENQSLGTFISTEKGNRYETADNKAESVEVDIKNPLVVENDLGLVGKRTEILNNNKDQFTKEDTVDYQELPNGKITLDDLNDAGIKKLAKLTTEKLQADGYDGIYFKESKTQEGELVVFDKNKVKFKEQTPIADEKPTLKTKEKQDLVKSLNKEQVKEFIKLKTPQEKEAYLINKRDKEQKLKNDKHDRLVSLMREYNSTPSNRTTRKQEIRQSMLKLSSDLGYSIKAKEGDKLEVLNSKGKLIRKINIPIDEKPATAENIEKVKELTHWFNWNGNDLDFHIDAVKLGLTWQNIRTALADINAGKTESTNINRVANAINEYGNMESLPLVRGFGGNYERLDVTGDDLFWAQKVNEATELLSGYEYNEAEREQALKDLSETDEKEFEQYSDLYSKFANQDGTLNWEEALKYEQANKTTTDESAKGQGSSNIIGDGKNSQQLQKEKRSAAEIKSELKIKEAELKKLEEKQSQLNKQLEQNLKENQLDLLQGAKPQAMFDDKVEQQKIAEKSKSDIENKRKEIAKLNDELDNINQEEIPFQSTNKKFIPISKSKFNELLDKLKKAFPNVKVELFGKNDFDNARKELEKRGIVVTDTKTKDGTIYGFKTPDGKVFLNSDAINANTPIHEYAHIWQSVFPNEFAKGISLLVQSPQGRELINEIRKNPAYKGKSITEIQAEALVTAIGNKGETIFNSNPTLYNKFKQWLNDLFAKIGDKLGIKNLSPDDKFDMFTKKVVGELLGGKVLDSKVGTEKSTEKTITFQGQNIKVKEINGGAEVVNGFYSPLEKIINETKFEKLPAKQWIDKFAKGEEAKWTGLTDWLSQQQDSISKADIQQFLKDNRIQVVEVVKGSYSKEVDDLYKKLEAKNKGREFDAWDVKDQDEWMAKRGEPQETKFSQYQLEGEKENYKEVLVTMPNKIKSVQFWKLSDGERRNSNGDLIAVKINGDWIDKNEAKVKYGIDYDTINNESEYKFKSSHFDEPNILVHLRMNTRVDADGNKVLFLEEVQSDWGQKGKKEGFKSDEAYQKADDAYGKYLDRMKAKYGKDYDEYYTKEESDEEYTLLGNRDAAEKAAIPQAPFVTDTNAWTKLGLKVALKEAVKQGADKIAWTTGEQQNDRYDLSKQVDEIQYLKNDNGTYLVHAIKGGERIESKSNLNEKDLEGMLGKDVAKRIVENEGQDIEVSGLGGYIPAKSLRGQQLSVGGKGMKGFYGSPTEGSLGIVGNVAKSLFKQEPKTVELQNTSTGIASQDKVLRLRDWVQKNKNEDYSYNDAQKDINDNSKLYQEYQKNTPTQHSIGITPEMKAQVELGQPLFQFKPDELTKKVQELRDFELTDSEIRDYLLEAGNTKQQIDDALGVKEVEENKDETKKELSDSKQRVAERIVLGNSTLNAVKEHIVQQGYDKSDYDSKQIFKDVDELINKFGIEKAESFIDKIGDVGLSEPHKVVLQHKIAEYYGNKALSDENLTEEERKEAMFKSAQLFLDLSQQRTDAGRGNAILAQIYLESDIYFTLPYFEDKMNAIGAQLSGAEKIELENLQNEIADLRKENTKLQELAKKEAEQQIVDDITTHLLVDDLIIDSKIKDDLEVKNAKSILAKGFEDIARMLSSIAMAQQVDKVKFKDTILDMTKATMTISKIGVKKALKSVIKAIKNANQNIDEKLLEDAEKHVLSQIKETDTGIKKKNKEGISKDELIELIEQGADTMEKMVEAIRNKYYDGDKSISDKQIRDEITNYGNSIRQSQTQVEEKLSEIKSLMLLQSKLEDAENNIAPKKTGFIRDKDKIAVREKRRELAEAMKKLTVTLSEDDIAGLNERKLTQIANKIEEVQKVLDGYEKIKNKANFDYNDAVKKKQQELDDLMSSQKALLHYAKENLTNLVAKYQDKLDKKQYSKNPTLNKLSITDSEYQKLKNQLEAKKEQLKSERDNFRNNNADYLLENRQKQIDRQIVEIDNLLAGIKVRKTSEQIKAEKDRKAGVINSSTNQTALDKLKENQNQLEAKKEQWERKVIQKEVEIEKAKQTWLQKLGINAMSISRTLTLGFTDIGWLGVQGGYFARTKPHLFAKALKESFKGKLSEDAFNQWKRDLKSNPFYETMIKAGLRIPSQSLRDDIFEQEFRESGFTKLLGKNEVTDIVNKNARLSVKFLANLRIQVFQKMYNGLTDSQKADKEVLEKLADYVNSRSGAGQVIGEDNKRGLNKWWSLLTSARNTSAMLQQTYIGMLYGLAKNYVRNKPLSNQPIIARQLVNDLLNQAVLFSGLYLSYLIANGLSGDDDEWNVETSPFSTNFLKLKNKEGDRSYFDMGGMTALNVATLRLLTTITNAFGTDFDNFKDYKGEYSKVGLKDFSSKTGLQILSESIFNRTLSLLAPIKNPFTAKSDKDGNYSMYGKTYTPTEFKLKMLMDMFIPMNLPNIYNDITDKDVNALNAIVNTVLNVIGISNQNQKYDKPEDSTSPQVNSVPVKSTPVSSMPIVPRPVK